MISQRPCSKVICLALVALPYCRRLCVLNSITGNINHEKLLLRTKSELLERKNKDLFLKKFREKASETVKAYKQFKELLTSAVFEDLQHVNWHFWNRTFAKLVRGMLFPFKLGFHLALSSGN